MADQASGPFKMEGRSPVDKVWVSLRQRHGDIDGADRLPAFRTPVGTHDEIEQLYSEASVRAYRAEAVLAELNDGSRVSALCFNLVVPPDPKEANSEYAAKLRNLARRLGLPANYVESIQ